MTAAMNRAERRRAKKMVKGVHRNPDGSVEMSLVSALTHAAQQHQSGNLAVAESLYKAVLRSAPENPDALQLLGVLHHQKGEDAESFRLLERARASAPENPEIHANFGAVLTDAGHLGMAEDSLRRALAIAPAHQQARLNLVRLLRDVDRPADAMVACREGLTHAPDDFLLNKFLAELLLKGRDFENAGRILRKCLALQPGDAAAMNDLAICCRELGDPLEADAWYRKAVEAAPDMTTIRYNYGAFLLSHGRTEEAREHLDVVLAENPDHWMTLTMLALKLIKLGHEQEAIATLHRIAEAHPDEAPVWNDVGAQFMEIGKFEEAAKMFKRATELDPERVEPQTNLGNAYLKQGRGYDAIREYEKAIKMCPMHLEAHVALARAFKDVHRFDEANIYAHATLMLPTYSAKYYSNPLQIFRSTCDYDGLAELGDIWKLLQSIQAVDVATALLQLLIYAEDGETVRRLAGHARRWTETIEAQAAEAPLPPRPPAPPRQKLRIGVLSSDLRHHSVSRFVLPLMEKYDREKLEIFCYCPIRIDSDAIQQRFKSLADKFVFVENQTDRETAVTIAQDDVDILLELNGYTQGTKIAALAYRPAPVQVAWLGYPFTASMKDVDYVMVDKYYKPDADDGMMEKPLVIPGSWACFGEGLNFEAVEILPNPPVDRNNGVVTFGTLNNTYKYTPRMIGVWAEVLKKVPESRFLVVRPECGSMIACRNMAKAFEAHGISTDRLYFINNRGRSLPHLAYYNEIDICLDTAPLTGGTTTHESLWMGVPVVTLVGPYLHQRISYAILKHVGLDECCAHTPEEFVERAVALAKNTDRIREFRNGLRGMVTASPLAQPEAFARNFETAMQELARRHGQR